MLLPIRTRLLCLSAAALLAACAASPVMDPGTTQRIAFIDSDGFDRQVQGALGARAETVDIAMLAPASVNSLPLRLGKVLSTVQDAGGKVTLQATPANDSSGKSLSLLGLIPALFDAVADLRLRQAYRDYDADVTVVDGQVTRVQLKKAR